MKFKKIDKSKPGRDLMTAMVAQRRARRFVGSIGKTEDPIRQEGDEDQERGRADYLLQCLHATLSAQRTLWSVYEMLRNVVRTEVGHELSDTALSYIGTLAADGMVDLVTHEHVAELLALKDPAEGPQFAQVGVKP